MGIWWRWEEREGAERGAQGAQASNQTHTFQKLVQHVLPVTVDTGVTGEARVSYNLKSSNSMKFQEVRSC